MRSVGAEPESFVKLIGDTALLVFTEPQQAIGTAAAVLLDDAGHDLLPAVRIGIRTGRVDWSDRGPCGPVVKLASRVVAPVEARSSQRGRSLVSFLQAPGSTSAPPISAAASTPIRLVEISTSTTPSSVDPVCQMPLSRGHGAATVVHDGRRWELCSIACARRFTVTPRPLPRASAGPRTPLPRATSRAGSDDHRRKVSSRSIRPSAPVSTRHHLRGNRRGRMGALPLA